MRALFDGSFEHLLCVVFESFENKVVFEEVTTKPTTIEPYTTIAKESHKIERVQIALTKWESAIRERLHYAFLNDSSTDYTDLYLYLVMGFKSHSTLHNPNITYVASVERKMQEVTKERHRYLGFVRFKETSDGVLFATIEPKTFVLPLLGHHFKERLGDMGFVIYDALRRKALICHERKLDLVDVSDIEMPTLSDDEAMWQHAWQRYFTTVAIKERINPKLQRQWVPTYYRNYLSEFEVGFPQNIGGENERRG